MYVLIYVHKNAQQTSTLAREKSIQYAKYKTAYFFFFLVQYAILKYCKKKKAIANDFLKTFKDESATRRMEWRSWADSHCQREGITMIMIFISFAFFFSPQVLLPLFPLPASLLFLLLWPFNIGFHLCRCKYATFFFYVLNAFTSGKFFFFFFSNF